MQCATVKAAKRNLLFNARSYAAFSVSNTTENTPLYSPDRVERPKPQSPSFYTGRQGFHDRLHQLEDTVGVLRNTMKQMQLLPLAPATRQVLPPAQPAWKPQGAIATVVGGKLNTSRHRKLLAVLNEMDELRRIAQVANATTLMHGVAELLDPFEREDKEAHLKRGKRKPVAFDEYGRSYTLGKRKTSSARVWIIPSKTLSQPPASTGSAAPTTEGAFQTHDALTSNIIDSMGELRDDTPIPTTSILINSVPINHYFIQPKDRERIVRPLKLSGLLGAYHIFCLVRGGGKSGQSGAVAHGITKGLVAHVPEVERVLKKAKLLRRDPREVERKKTGRAKARKAYQWVKR